MRFLSVYGLLVAASLRAAQPTEPLVAGAGSIELKAVSAQPATVQTNLLANGRFEAAGADGIPVGWLWDRRNTDATCVTDSQVVHSGKRALKLTNGTSFGANVFATLWLSDAVAVKPGRPYTMSAWIRSEAPGRVGLIGGGDWQYRVWAPATGKTWQRIALTFTPDEKDREFVLRLNTESPSPGVWVDDVRLEEGTEPSLSPSADEADSSYALAPVKPGLEVQEDGAFSLGFTAWIPRAFKGPAEVQLDGARMLRQTLTLEPGAWNIRVKGEAHGVDKPARTATLSLSESGRVLAKAAMPVTFFSPSRATARLAGLQARLPTLRGQLEALKQQGNDIAYPLVSYTVLENFHGYAQTDIEQNEIRRASQQLDDLEPMATRLARELAEAQAGKLSLVPVPRWTAEQRPAIEGSSFVANTRTPGQSPVRRPVFFTGYGHFNQVVADLEKWPAYGVNIIQIEFGPSSVMPKEGVVSQEPMHQMLRTLDRAQKAGVAVCLLISPHYFPDWALAKWPHLRKHREGFLNYCLHAPEGRELLRQYVMAAIAPLKGHPALHSVCLSNEPINQEEPCPTGTKAWQAWLEQRHGTIAALNAVCGSNFVAFAQVPLPNPFGQRPAPGLWMDYIRFNQEFFAEWHRMLADAVHAVAPALPVHAKAMTWTLVNDSDVRLGVDATLFARFSNLNGNDAVNWYSFGEEEFAQGWQGNAMGHDLQYSVLKAPIFNTENHVIADRETRFVPASHVRTALWQAAVHGQGATTIWVWERTSDPQSDFAGSIMHRPACAEAVGIVNHDLNRAALEITALQQAPSQVLLLQSVTASVADLGSYGDCLDKLYTALAFTGLKIGFVTERQLEAGLVPPASVLFVPNITHLSDAAFATLRRWHGRLVFVGGGELLTRDEYGRPRSERLAADRLAYRYGPTQWRELWQGLWRQLPGWKLQPDVLVADRDGQPVWGVEWRVAETAQGTVLNLCNYRREPVTVKLSRQNTSLAVCEVLSGRKLGTTLSLDPLQPVLARAARSPVQR